MCVNFNPSYVNCNCQKKPVNSSNPVSKRPPVKIDFDVLFKPQKPNNKIGPAFYNIPRPSKPVNYKPPKMYPLGGKTPKGERLIDANCVAEANRPVKKNYLKPNESMVENNNITNGRINDFIQGAQRGDCYLLASLYSLGSTKKGKEYIKDCITYNDDGSVTVKLPGALKLKDDYSENNDKNLITGIYRITKEALEKADKEAGKMYSYGDKDVRIMELAFEAYRAETLISNYAMGNSPGVDEAGNSGGGNRIDPLSSGSSYDSTYIITGKPSELYQNKDKIKDIKLYIPGEYGYVGEPKGQKYCKTGFICAKKTDKEITNFYDKESDLQKMLDKYKGKESDYAISVSVMCGIKDSLGRIRKGGGHAMAVTKITDEYVEIANPHHTNRKERIPRADFEKMAYKLSVTKM